MNNTTRLPMSLKFDNDSELYQELVLPLKNERKLAGFVVDLLGIYYTNSEVRQLVDAEMASPNPLDEVMRQIESIQLEHHKLRMLTSMVSGKVKSAHSTVSNQGVDEGVAPEDLTERLGKIESTLPTLISKVAKIPRNTNNTSGIIDTTINPSSEGSKEETNFQEIKEYATLDSSNNIVTNVQQDSISSNSPVSGIENLGLTNEPISPNSSTSPILEEKRRNVDTTKQNDLSEQRLLGNQAIQGNLEIDRSNKPSTYTAPTIETATQPVVESQAVPTIFTEQPVVQAPTMAPPVMESQPQAPVFESQPQAPMFESQQSPVQAPMFESQATPQQNTVQQPMFENHQPPVQQPMFESQVINQEQHPISQQPEGQEVQKPKPASFRKAFKSINK